MEKSKWATLSDRLKIGGERLSMAGADMSKKFTGKMKEILQPQSQESKFVHEATLETSQNPNWGLIMNICNRLNNGDFNGTLVMSAIKKRIAASNMVTQRLTLHLLEVCAMNCEKVFSEIASEKVLDEIVSMIDNPQTHHSNRQRALEIIQGWGQSAELRYLPVFHQTYMNLRNRKASSPDPRNGNCTSVCSPVGNVFNRPEGYPYPEQQNNDQDFLGYHDVSLSVEEKREVLTVTRNSMEILSSLLNSETPDKDMPEDLMMSLADKCKDSQPVIHRILESAGDDEALLFDALSLHEELEHVMSRYAEGMVVASAPAVEERIEKCEEENDDCSQKIEKENMDGKKVEGNCSGFSAKGLKL